MSAEQSLRAKIEHAEAMHRAGSYKRAKELCKEILEKEDDNLDAFQILFQIHMDEKNYAKAHAACNWRLERVPECVEAHMLKLLPLGHWKSKKEATELIENIRHRFGDRPFHLEQSEILYSHFFKPSSHTMWLLNKARDQGMIDPDFLDEIENYERAKSGQIFGSQKLLTEALQKNPEDYDTVFSLAVTRFYVGRLFSAIKLSRQAMRLKPHRAAECKEVIFASIVGLIPMFWGAQLFIIWVATITTRIPWFIRGPFNVIGFFLAFLLQSFIMMPFGLLLGGTTDEPYTGVMSSLVGISVAIQFLWIIYLLFGFQHIGSRMADSRKQVKLSNKY